MNTPLFYILQSAFILLYMLEFALWRRIRKSDTFEAAPKRGVYRYAPLCVYGAAAILSAGVFVADASCKFRLTLMAFLIAPVVVVHLRSLVLEGGHCVRLYSIMIYALFIPMCFLYLR